MKISIVTAVLNGGGQIADTVKSVFNQNYPELEYIVIDGGSSDATLRELAPYRDRLAALVSEPDGGIYEAMNKGIALATGDVVGIINCGDRYFDGAFQRVAAAFGGAPPGKWIFWGDVQYEKRGRVPGFRPGHLRLGAFAPHPSMFVPLEIYREYGVYDESFRLLGDYEFMYRMVNKKRVRPLYVPELIAYYREGGVSDRHIAACLAEELQVKLRYGGRPIFDRALYFAKLLKNLPRMLLAK